MCMPLMKNNGNIPAVLWPMPEVSKVWPTGRIWSSKVSKLARSNLIKIFTYNIGATHFEPQTTVDVILS